MAAPSKTMTPERIAEAMRLRAKGLCCKEAAIAMGVPFSTLAKWADTYDAKFRDGRAGRRQHGVRSEAFKAAARRTIVKAREAAAAKNRLPLNETERKAYRAYQAKLHRSGVPFTRDEAFAAIGRSDLVGAQS